MTEYKPVNLTNFHTDVLFKSLQYPLKTSNPLWSERNKAFRERVRAELRRRNIPESDIPPEQA